MTTHDDEDPRRGTEAMGALAPPPPSTPSADDVRALVRSNNWRTVALVIPFLALVVGVVWYAADTRAGAQDSFNATDVFLANQPRSACITERRNEQAEYAGRISIYANEAEVAGLVNDDEAGALRWLAKFQAAVASWEDATASLSEEVLDEPPPLGCGPPILTLEDLPDD